MFTFNNNQLPQRAKKIIAENSDLTKYLKREREKYPFPNNYVPEEIEILIDNVPIAIEELSSYQESTTIDIRFDGECAFFSAGGIAIIDRRPSTFKE